MLHPLPLYFEGLFLVAYTAILLFSPLWYHFKINKIKDIKLILIPLKLILIETELNLIKINGLIYT